MKWTPEQDAILHGVVAEANMWPGVAALFRNATGILVTVDQVRNRAKRIGAVLRPKTAPVEREATTAIRAGQRIKFAVVSDTHGGSKYEQLTALRSFYEYAEGEGVEFFVHAGDLTQGADQMHLGMEHEVHAHGADAQARYVALTYPMANVPTYVLGGNHDYSFMKNGGVNVVTQIVGQRKDLIYLGQDAAYLKLGRLNAYVIHPDGGGGMSKSLRGQKIAETLDPSINLLLIGHFHQWCQFVYRSRMQVFVLPCFQSQYGWLARKGLHPEVGGLILELTIGDDGKISSLKQELKSYPVLPNDYDHEASRQVNEAWEPLGVEIAA